MPSAEGVLVIEKGEDFEWLADVRENTQTLTIVGGPTGGTFTLMLWGSTTANIAYDATAADVESALEALATVGSGNASVSGGAGGPWVVTFNDAVKRLPSLMHPLLKAFSSLTPGGGLTIANTLRDLTGWTGVAQLWGDYEDVEDTAKSPLATFTVSLNTPTGRIKVTLAKATVDALPECAGVWGLRMQEPASGPEHMYVSGPAIVKPRTVRT